MYLNELQIFMKFLTNSNIIPLFKGVIEAILPYARSNQVNLTFNSAVNELFVEYHPVHVIHDIAELLCNVIAFTPQSYNVELKLNEITEGDQHFLKIEIINDGANLERIKEITAQLKNKFDVTSLGNKGTQYQLFISNISQLKYDKNRNSGKINHHGIPPYYAQIRKQLRSHFSNIESLEKSATQKSQQEGVFLQKVNALIISNLGFEGYNISNLCEGLALSRSQLYRKLKNITHIPPAHYIQFIRLQKAKEYLQNTDMNVGEVVVKVGFASHSHFTRAFHDQFGINPSFLKKSNTSDETNMKHRVKFLKQRG